MSVRQMRESFAFQYPQLMATPDVDWTTPGFPRASSAFQPLQLKNDELISPRPSLIFSFPDRIRLTNLPTICQLANAELETRQPGFFTGFFFQVNGPLLTAGSSFTRVYDLLVFMF